MGSRLILGMVLGAVVMVEATPKRRAYAQQPLAEASVEPRKPALRRYAVTLKHAQMLDGKRNETAFPQPLTMYDGRQMTCSWPAPDRRAAVEAQITVSSRGPSGARLDLLLQSGTSEGQAGNPGFRFHGNCVRCIHDLAVGKMQKIVLFQDTAKKQEDWLEVQLDTLPDNGPNMTGEYTGILQRVTTTRQTTIAVAIKPLRGANCANMELAQDVKVILDGKPAKLADLKEGMDLTLQMGLRPEEPGVVVVDIQAKSIASAVK